MHHGGVEHQQRRADAHHPAPPAVQGRQARGHVEKPAGVGAEREQQQHRRRRPDEVVQRRAARPQVLEAQPVLGQKQQGATQHVQHVAEVGLFLEKEEQNQVIQHHDEQDAVENAEQPVLRRQLGNEAGPAVQHGPEAVAAVGTKAQVVGHGLSGPGGQVEQKVFVGVRAGGKGQAGPGFHAVVSRGRARPALLPVGQEKHRSPDVRVV